MYNLINIGGCIKNKGGKVVINGGTFNVNNYVEYSKGGACVVENNGNGTIIINGGTFNNEGTGSGGYYLYTAGSGAITYTDAAVFTGKPFNKLGNNIEKK